MARSSRARTTSIRFLAAAAALALLLPAEAAAAKKAGTSSVTYRTIEGCTFEVTYTWSDFGSPSQEATGAVSLFLREPGEADENVTFSSYGFPSEYSLRSGTFTYQFGDQAGYFRNPVPSVDAQLVFVGQLVWQKRHFGTLIVDEARAETVIPIPAACLPA